jgi:hypothetical protein
MNTPAEWESSEERRYRRQRHLSLGALPVVLLCALWVAAGDQWLDYRKQHRRDFVDTPLGNAVSFGGSQWRLEEIDMPPADPLHPLRSGLARLRVRIAVTPQDEAAIKRLGRCSLTLVDARARRWTAASTAAPGVAALPDRCDGNYRNPPEIGGTLHFEQWFMLPAAVANEVEPVVALVAQQPTELRLRRY